MVASRTSLHAFQVDRKCEAQDAVVMGMAHHLVLKMINVLYLVTYSRVVVECWSGELLQELTSWIFLERRDSWILAVRVG